MSPTTRPTTAATPTLTALSDPAATAAIDTACRALMLPTVRTEAASMAAAAAKQRLSHKAFLAEVLLAECDERDARHHAEPFGLALLGSDGGIGIARGEIDDFGLVIA